jgi:cytochrome c oxidase subunit 2
MPPLYAQASTFAPAVDQLMLALLLFCFVVSAAITSVILFFAIRYHKSNKRVDRSNPPDHSLVLEIGWTFAAVVLVMGIFFWGASIYVRQQHAPDDALQIYITGKQWMWKTYYPDGQQEINGLHVPIGRAVKLAMISQDVVHSFYIPAFRVKQDVVPGRYTSMWFEATVPGIYHLFCAEYCGTKHSEMVGKVEVMEPSRFQEWLSGRGGAVSLAQAGEKLYQKLGCVACHQPQAGGSQRGPKLEGLFGQPVKLSGGRTVVADENYIRESIVDPRAKLVDGYEPVMPSYEGQITAEELTELLAYVKSLAQTGAK